MLYQKLFDTVMLNRPQIICDMKDCFDFVTNSRLFMHQIAELSARHPQNRRIYYLVMSKENPNFVSQNLDRKFFKIIF